MVLQQTWTFLNSLYLFFPQAALDFEQFSSQHTVDNDDPTFMKMPCLGSTCSRHMYKSMTGSFSTKYEQWCIFSNCDLYLTKHTLNNNNNNSSKKVTARPIANTLANLLEQKKVTTQEKSHFVYHIGNWFSMVNFRNVFS